MRSAARLAGVAAIGLMIACLCIPTLAGAAGPQVEQSIGLHPGWNAVYLDVAPEPREPASVFAGLPVKSVWTYLPRGTTQYIQDPGEQLLKEEGWHVWFSPASGKDPMLNSLFAILPGFAYLVEVEGSAPVTWTVHGVPVLRRHAWATNSFNFTGFTVDPAAPPTFGAFFAPSAAHAGQAVYRLGEGGTWELVDNPGATTMRPGEAFWIYTTGASDYSGPLKVVLDYGDGLDFGALTPAREVRITNLASETRSISLRSLPTAAGLPLRIRKLDAIAQAAWPALDAEPPLVVPPSVERRITLSVAWPEIPPGSPGAVVEIRDGAGFLARIPVSAAPLAQGAPDFTGLWVGTVIVNAVTEAQIPARAEFSTPQPAPYDFSFRLILHVGSDRKVRLLKEVTQMRNSQGQPVLITDDNLIPSFESAELRDGREFSNRISTAAFDFSGNQLDLAGTFSMTGDLNCAINLDPNMPTNPFLHKYHPDHNDLDELGNQITNEAIMESFRVQRQIELAFSQDDPTCAGVAGCVNPPEWGYTRVGGVYRETLSGLHRNQIKVAGIFILKRVTDIPDLNPGVTP